MAAGRRSVVWAESARAALDDVVTYIAQDSREAAVRVLVATLDTASSLDQHAERGRIVPELNQPDLRELFVFDYRLLYRVRQMKWSSLLTCTARATSQPGVGSSVAVPATNRCSAVIARDQLRRNRTLVCQELLVPAQRRACPSQFDEGRHREVNHRRTGRPFE